MPVVEPWARSGLTLLWGAEALRDLAEPSQVLPLRSLFSWRGEWPAELPANEGRTLVATGLEATLDCLAQDDAEAWLAFDLRDLVLGFQQAYEGQRALVLWLPSGQQRVACDPATDAWLWTTTDNSKLPLGRLLFSGAASDARAISPPGWRGAKEGPGLIGLHQARLS